MYWSILGNGTVEFQEFLEMILGQPVQILSQEEDELLQAFKVFDPDSTGFISIPKLKYVLTKIGKDPLNDSDDVEDLLAFADLNNEGMVNYDGKVNYP